MITGPQRQASDSTLLTGLAIATPVFFNPDQGQLQEIYGEAAKEPHAYTGQDKDGNVQLRLDVWFKFLWDGKDKFVKGTIFLTNKTADSTKTPGSSQWINDRAQTRWAVDINSIPEDQKKFFDIEANPRRAFQGEDALYDLLVNWSNTDQRAEGVNVKLDTPFEDIIGGNVEELNLLIEQIKRPVGIMLGVRKADDGNTYQDVYTKCFVAATPKPYTKKLAKQLTAAGYEWKSDYQGSFELKEYVPLDVTSTTEVVTKKEATRMI